MEIGMSNILKITKFHLLTLFKWQSIAFLATLVLNVLISVVVTRLVEASGSGANTSAGSLDPTALVWMFIIGIVFFATSFKFMMSHGVSRRRFFLASGLSLVSMSAIWAILLTIFIVVSRTFTNIWVVFDLLYRGWDLVSMAVWEFAGMFLLAVLGWLIYLIYYVSGLKTKYIITAAPFVVIPLLALFNIMANGVIFEAIGKFVINAMGFASNVPNPYIGAGSMLIFSLILGGAVFLLIRRAQVND
jgi:hypothetical protein